MIIIHFKYGQHENLFSSYVRGWVKQGGGEGVGGGGGGGGGGGDQVKGH